MRIVFFDNRTNEEFTDNQAKDLGLFVMSNRVFADNNKCFESQCSCVSFEDFIVEKLYIGWKAVKDQE